jgi:hypothetical protein
MATKKKKKAPSKGASKASARPRVTSAPVQPPASPAPGAPAPQSSFAGLLTVLVVAGIFGLAWLVVRGCAPKDVAVSATPPVPAAPAPAAPAAANTPEARSIVTPAKAEAAQATAPKAQPSAHREAAGGETGAPSLTLDRSSGKPLSLRCWRPEGGQASLDVFAPRNRVVANLTSDSGAAGWVDLSWNGKDSQGKKVPEGLYFLRPSQRSEETVRDVWVKD